MFVAINFNPDWQPIHLSARDKPSPQANQSVSTEAFSFKFEVQVNRYCVVSHNLLTTGLRVLQQLQLNAIAAV